MHYIPAKILAKAAAFTFPQHKDPAHACPQLEAVLVSKVWIQSTNRVAAFRAPGLRHFEGYMKLTPKLTKAGVPRAFPKTATEVRFDNDLITAETAAEARVKNAKGKTLATLGDFFDIELLWERPSFPDLDRVFPKKKAKTAPPRFMFDLALFSKLMAGEPPGKQLNVAAELGSDELSPVVIRNDAIDRDHAWEAVLMPVRP
jgi:hypothetical protein